jgi:hypothetical protein
MIFPSVVFLVVCGAMLYTGGVLMDSPAIVLAGAAFWFTAAAILLKCFCTAVRGAYLDYKLRKALGKRSFDRDYRPGRGLR